MNTLNQNIAEHYLKEGLYEDILKRLQEQNISLDAVQRSDIAAADEFHVRGAAVSNELAQSVQLEGMKVLDIGCGLGGPCRMLADEYNCDTVGIDLSHEYIRTANKLSELLQLQDKTRFVQGYATQLPFEDQSFDVVWTQHVQMNVPDKEAFYSEVHRVLKGNGHFLYYDILKKGNGDIAYPMPWASHQELSFLFQREEMEGYLSNLGLSEMHAVDQSQAGVAFFEALIKRLQESGAPIMGLNVLMGESTKPKLMNLYQHLKDGHLELRSGGYRKLK